MDGIKQGGFGCKLSIKKGSIDRHLISTNMVVPAPPPEYFYSESTNGNISKRNQPF